METVDEILDRALQLSPRDRASVAESLIRSLEPEGEELSEEKWKQVWGEEIERRIAAYEKGEVSAVDWEESITRIRNAIREGTKH